MVSSGYARSYSSTPSLFSEGNAVWVIISLVLAIVGGIVLYFTFLSKKNEGKLHRIFRMDVWFPNI